MTMPRFHVQQEFANSCLYGGLKVGEASAKTTTVSLRCGRRVAQRGAIPAASERLEQSNASIQSARFDRLAVALVLERNGLRAGDIEIVNRAGLIAVRPLEHERVDGTLLSA